MSHPVEKAASKVMGAVKAAKATVEGLSGVFRHLATEHGEVSALLMRVKASSDPKLRSELFPTIRSELLSHEKGELEVVYPALAQHAETQMIVSKHNQEAAQLEKMLEQLTQTSVEDESTWRSRFNLLVETVQHHALEEENEFFPTAQRVLGEGQATALLPRYEKAKAAAKNNL